MLIIIFFYYFSIEELSVQLHFIGMLLIQNTDTDINLLHWSTNVMNIHSIIHGHLRGNLVYFFLFIILIFLSQKIEHI